MDKDIVILYMSNDRLKVYYNNLMKIPGKRVGVFPLFE